jgi:hypothetical protein
VSRASSFVDCLKTDHIKDAFEKKLKVRESNVKAVLDQFESNSRSLHDQDKLYMQQGEIGGTSDFVDLLSKRKNLQINEFKIGRNDLSSRSSTDLK